jgi:hypothetical protein
MAPIPLILMVFSFVCFVLACFPQTEPYRPRLVPAGLAFWALTVILGFTGVLGGK